MERNFKICLFASVALGCLQIEASAMDETDLESISTHVIRGNQDVSEWCAERITNKITKGSIRTAADFRKAFSSFRETLLSRQEKFKNFPENFNKASTYIENISIDPELICSSDTSIFTLQGSLIGTSDLIELTPDELKNFSELNIYSKHSVLIDQDFKVPGVNVTLLAPHWFVVGQKKISLKGRDGDDYRDKMANPGVGYNKDDGTGNNGEDGRPGLPGESGGHFFGRGKSFYPPNTESLIIDVSGGKGGKGQNGGNGAQGRDGKVGNLDDVENRKESAQKSSEPILFDDNVYLNFLFTFGNEKFRQEYESGTIGKQGGDAGKGGKGGYPGQSGFASIQGVGTTGSEHKIYSLVNHSMPGDNGDPGIPGGVGSYRIYARTYINEITSPNFITKVKTWDEYSQQMHGWVTAGETVAAWLLGGTVGGLAGGTITTIAVGGAGLLAGTATTLTAGPALIGATVGSAVLLLAKGGGSAVSSVMHSGWEGDLKVLNPTNTPYSGEVPSKSNLNKLGMLGQKDAKPGIVLKAKKKAYKEFMNTK